VPTGHLLSTLTPDATADAALRRRQYFAQATGQDVLICQELLRRKLAAQRATLVSHPELPGQAHALDVLDTALAWLTLPELPPWLMSVDMVRTYEARTARAYFAAWDGWTVRWDKAGAKRVPPHWKVARDRSSPLAPGSNARHVVDPLNAMLNYAYALLEGQCRQALTRLGFDVVCGFLHLDKLGRDSLVYDLMECERGTVDGLVFDFLARTTLHYGDVTPVSDGSCRLHPQLARAVVAGCRVAQGRLEEHARWLRSVVLVDPQSLPTALNASAFQRRRLIQRHSVTMAVPLYPQ
jgi:CRISPR-associated endonuclease Cas1